MNYKNTEDLIKLLSEFIPSKSTNETIKFTNPSYSKFPTSNRYSTPATSRITNSKILISIKDRVWAKGLTIKGLDPSKYRLDHLGNIIVYSRYGKRNLSGNWEIDHELAKSLGGSDHLNNLRPLNGVCNAIHGGILSKFKSK